jgi:hypothetical protein
MAFIVANAQAAVADDNASPEIVAATRDAMVFMAEAPLRIAEAQIPKYVVISEDVVLSAPESDAEMLEIWSTITAALDIHTPGLRIADPVGGDEDDADDAEDADDALDPLDGLERLDRLLALDALESLEALDALCELADDPLDGLESELADDALLADD